MTRQFRPEYNSIYHEPLTIDGRGFVRVYGVKVARYLNGNLEFMDHSRRSNSQVQSGGDKARVVEIKAEEFIKRLWRV